MKQRKVLFERNQKGFQSGEKNDGLVILMIIPVFLAILAFATGIAGYISYSIQAMAHRNEMVQAYSLLEDDSVVWQEEVASGKWNDVYEKDYEKVVSTQTVGPYILLVKEMRNKTTGKVLVNRFEFIPIKNADDRKS